MIPSRHELPNDIDNSDDNEEEEEEEVDDDNDDEVDDLSLVLVKGEVVDYTCWV